MHVNFFLYHLPIRSTVSVYKTLVVKNDDCSLKVTRYPCQKSIVFLDIKTFCLKFLHIKSIENIICIFQNLWWNSTYLFNVNLFYAFILAIDEMSNRSLAQIYENKRNKILMILCDVKECFSLSMFSCFL